MKQILLKISGMHCTACALSIDLDLEELSGIKSAKTNYAKGETVVDYDTSLISPDQIIQAIAKTGYTAVH